METAAPSPSVPDASRVIGVVLEVTAPCRFCPRETAQDWWTTWRGPLLKDYQSYARCKTCKETWIR